MPQHGRDLFSQLNILWPSGELTGPRDSFAAKVDRDFDAVLMEIQPFVARTPKEALGLKLHVPEALLPKVKIESGYYQPRYFRAPAFYPHVGYKYLSGRARYVFFAGDTDVWFD